MRVLHVIASLDPKGGGTTENLLQLAQATSETEEMEMEVACFDEAEESWLTSFPALVNALGRGRTSYRYCSAFVPWLRKNAARFDAFVVHGLWQYPGYATRLVARELDIPYFVFPHGMLDPWFKKAYPLKHLKKWLYWPWGEYRVLRDATAVFFTCEEERRLARDSFWLYQCRGKVVGIGIGLPPTQADQQDETFLTRFSEFRKKRLLLFLSRIHEKKGCDLLIRAFGKAVQNLSLHERDPLHLVVAGPCADQGYLDEMNDLAKECCPTGSVSFPGMLSGDLKWGAFHAAEVFVLPSHQENFGIAVVEALACKRPVLISDKVNIWREI